MSKCVPLAELGDHEPEPEVEFIGAEQGAVPTLRRPAFRVGAESSHRVGDLFAAVLS